MKLASLKVGGRDGTLIIVDGELKRGVSVPDIAPTLQAALDGWENKVGSLQAVSSALNDGTLEAFDLDMTDLAAPLPRAYQWLDGSAYLSHVERVRRARGADMPANLYTDPLMYQGASDRFLGPRDPILAADEAFGVDFESEVAVITDDVPQGVSPQQARQHIKLVTLVNDVSLRNLIPPELSKGFGFLQGKPASTMAPVVVTPDELGVAWDGAKVHLPLCSYWDDVLFGEPQAGKDMQFDFPRLISHAARTRDLTTGTVVGSGTVSNYDPSRGCSCIAERRVLEIIEKGVPVTPFMGYGDRVRIEMADGRGRSIFGAIIQTVQPC